jgi:tetratricopeptide (TPR) repeat protein
VGAALACCVPIPARAATPEAQRLNEAAVALTAQGRYEEAADLFGQALRLRPGDEVLRRNLARIYTVLGHRLLQAGSFQAAQQRYLAALELVPDESAALLGLGDAQLRMRETREAIETYRRVVSLEPRNPDAYLRLGQAYYNHGDLRAALSEWESALALRPDDGRLRQRVESVQREARVQSGFRTRDSQHFTVIYEGERREDLARDLLLILERAYTDVGYELGAYPSYEVQTIFYSEAEFTDSHYGTLDGKIRVGLKGLSLENPLLRSVLYHEYTHALIYAVTRGNNPPRWVHEGLAVRMEKWRAAGYKQEAIQRARTGTTPSLEASPYIHGSAAIEYLIERFGMPRIQQVLRRLGEGVAFPQAFWEAFGMSLATFQDQFRELLVRGY